MKPTTHETIQAVAPFFAVGGSLAGIQVKTRVKAGYRGEPSDK